MVPSRNNELYSCGNMKTSVAFLLFSMACGSEFSEAYPPLTMDPLNHRVHLRLQSIFGCDPIRPDLIALYTLIRTSMISLGDSSLPPLDRNAKRVKEVILKTLEDHASAVLSWLEQKEHLDSLCACYVGLLNKQRPVAPVQTVASISQRDIPFARDPLTFHLSTAADPSCVSPSPAHDSPQGLQDDPLRISRLLN